jgi:hypothetical protein
LSKKWDEKKYWVYIVVTGILISCAHFPDDEEIVGNWEEITQDTIKIKLNFLSNGILCFTYYPGGIDTFDYKLDPEKKRLFVKHLDYPVFTDPGMPVQLNDQTIRICGLSNIPEETGPINFKRD